MKNHLAHELRILAKNFSKEDFRPVSRGIGIEVRRKLIEEKQIKKIPQKNKVIHSGESNASLQSKKSKKINEKKRFSRSKNKTKENLNRVKAPIQLVLSLFFDVFTLVITIGIFLACLAFYLQPAGYDLLLYMNKLLQQFYSKQGPVRIAQCLAALFCAYWLVFKLLVGSTLGQITVKLFHRRS